MTFEALLGLRVFRTASIPELYGPVNHPATRPSVFTARAYARAVLGVVIVTVCLSVRRVHYDKSKCRTADIFIPHERAITLLLLYQDRFPLITSQPFKIAKKVQ